QFERDAEFWLDDGNLVLIARNTGFRIYRGLLAAQSEVFRDMFASSSPSTGECHDGCPVVYMSDSPEDLRRLLRVILPTTRRMFFPDDENQVDVSFNQVSAIVRLAHKYNIADLEGQAFSALKAYYTDSFDEHESAGFHSQVSFDNVHAIGAVNYARLANRLEILPYALYACCGLRGDIVYGWEREDGTVEHLSPEDLKHCLDGRDALAREAMRLLPKVF
ncbi:uncharacterized protein TRAVEDRAFT_99981, partial [Trametes versicolor FP-101664 SS1]|uniref:uncharacterized protein n=1 Tax=Trametes versicolor (strain FP-101664) TaxID=717944 RepID=UPI0004621E0A